MIFACLSVEEPQAGFLELDPSYEAGFLDADCLRRYAARPEYNLPEPFVARALAAQDECFAIQTGELLAAYGWYSTSTNRFSDELTLRFDPGWVYMYRGFTHPAARGRRLHAIGMTRALSAYRARGFKGLLTCVELANEASLRSCARMGYRVFGRIYVVRLGRLLGLRHPRGRFLNLPIVFSTPGCARFGFRLQRHGPAGESPGTLQLLKD